jgi:hypothetical protein
MNLTTVTPSWTYYRKPKWLMPSSNFFQHPATHSQGSLQIDLISISMTLLEFVNIALILNPTNSWSNHSSIGIDFNLAKLLQCSSLSEIDQSHHQSQNLVSTDIKSQTKYLKELRKHPLAHNIQNWIRDLYDQCETMGQCSTTDQKNPKNMPTNVL